VDDRDDFRAQAAHYRKLAEATKKKAEEALSPAVQAHHLAVARGFETMAAELEALSKD
jgi:hypothetical protein